MRKARGIADDASAGTVFQASHEGVEHSVIVGAVLAAYSRQLLVARRAGGKQCLEERFVAAVLAGADAEGRIDWSIMSVDSTSCRAHRARRRGS